jgi:hypothetical protein
MGVVVDRGWKESAKVDFERCPDSEDGELVYERGVRGPRQGDPDRARRPAVPDRVGRDREPPRRDEVRGVQVWSLAVPAASVGRIVRREIKKGRSHKC